MSQVALVASTATVFFGGARRPAGAGMSSRPGADRVV